MRKNSKYFAILMCCAFLFGSCGMQEDTPADSANQTLQTPTAVPQATETPAPIKPVAPILTITTQEKDWHMEDGSSLLMVATDFTVDIEQKGFETLEATLDRLHPGLASADYTNLIEQAEEHYQSLDEDGKRYFWGYSVTQTAELTRSDSAIVSLKTFYGEYTGGAHGMYSYGGETFYVESGKLLTLADILNDTNSFYAEAIDYVNDRLYTEYGDGLYADYRLYVEEAFTPEKTSNWYLDGGGIVILFSPYEIGPYAMGAPQVTLPYSEFGKYIAEKYMAPDGELIAYLPTNCDISPLLGQTENIMVETTDNEWYMLDTRIIAGAVNSELGSFSSCRDSYVVKRADNRCFMVVVCDYMSDDYVTFVYEVTDGVLKKCAELPDIYPSNGYVSTEKIKMNMHLDVLGSYIATNDYIFAEDGLLIPTNDFYPINATYPLTIIKDLPVTLDGTDTTLGVGTQILLTGTNNVDEAHFKVVGTDQTGIIHYSINEEESWIHYIDGVSEYEYFESLPYAG